MKALFYDWFGLNEWMFTMIRAVNMPWLDTLWGVLAYGYGYWVPGVIGLAACGFYLVRRHVMSAAALTRLADIMAVLILASCLLWAAVFTVQLITLLPAPWMRHPELLPVQPPLRWHEGLPASAPAMAMMVYGLFRPYVVSWQKALLRLYVGLACFLVIVAGWNWPADVAYGLLTGVLCVWFARGYYRLGKRCVAS